MKQRLFIKLLNSFDDIKADSVPVDSAVIVADDSESIENLKTAIRYKIEIEDIRDIYIGNGVKIRSLKELRDEDTLFIIKNENLISDDSWVSLNVGGRLFKTSVTTLRNREPESFFGRMFSNDYWTHRREKDGSVLIDRSSRYFDVILDYLRHGKLIVDSNLSLEGVLEEAKFYSLYYLVELAEKQISQRALDQTERDNKEIENIAKSIALYENDQIISNDSNGEFKLTRRHVIQSLMHTKSEAYLRFQSINLKGADLSRLDLSWINFKYANLSSANLSSSNLSFSCFERADLSKANLENAKCHGIRMACCNLESAVLSGADFEDPTGKAAILEGANLKNVNAIMCNMNNINLRVATLKNADFTGSSLKYSKLAGADLENCILNGCDLTEANLRGANFVGTTFNDVQNALHMSQVGIML